jgi:hypothetical protein
MPALRRDGMLLVPEALGEKLVFTEARDIKIKSLVMEVLGPRAAPDRREPSDGAEGLLLRLLITSSRLLRSLTGRAHAGRSRPHPCGRQAAPEFDDSGRVRAEWPGVPALNPEQL